MKVKTMRHGFGTAPSCIVFGCRQTAVSGLMQDLKQGGGVGGGGDEELEETHSQTCIICAII